MKVDGSFVSTAPAGTPPLVVSSPTKVDNLNADMLDGIDASEFARKLGNIVTVAKSGGDFTSVQAAIDSITTADANNPWVVFVGPGEYTEYVTMKESVSLVGAGTGETRITAAGGETENPFEDAFPTVTTAGDAELRDLTIRSDATSVSSNDAHGVLAEGSSKPVIVNVMVEATGSARNVGIINRGPGTLWINRSSISAIGPSTTGTFSTGIRSTGAFDDTNPALVVQRSVITSEGGDLPAAVVGGSSDLILLHFSTIMSGDRSGLIFCRFVIDEELGVVILDDESCG